MEMKPVVFKNARSFAAKSTCSSVVYWGCSECCVCSSITQMLRESHLDEKESSQVHNDVIDKGAAPFFNFHGVFKSRRSTNKKPIVIDVCRQMIVRKYLNTYS